MWLQQSSCSAAPVAAAPPVPVDASFFGDGRKANVAGQQDWTHCHSSVDSLCSHGILQLPQSNLQLCCSEDCNLNLFHWLQGSYQICPFHPKAPPHQRLHSLQCRALGRCETCWQGGEAAVLVTSPPQGRRAKQWLSRPPLLLAVHLAPRCLSDVPHGSHAPRCQSQELQASKVKDRRHRPRLALLLRSLPDKLSLSLEA
mmetsp:Transcript_15050/g.27477  ORF Transcript_15050/g.27477 Transcript_15050/m.27477 type:complete len:200 (+) Transcript_15050:602-1201(+)